MQETPSFKRRQFDPRSLLFVPFLVLALVIGILVNQNLGKNPEIVFQGLDINNDALSVNWNKYATYHITLKDTLTITKSGTYNIYGELENGSIIVRADTQNVKIILNGAKIKNDSGPAIACYEAENLVIESISESYLESGLNFASNTEENIDGVIYSKANTAFSGDGILNIKSNYQDAVVVKDDLLITGGSIKIKSRDDGIRVKDGVVIAGGNLDINSKADGIKSTNDQDPGKGFVYIKNGSLNINAGDDGIHAITQLVIDDGNINVARSYEGIESPVIKINGGQITVKASDDGINAGVGTSESNTPRPGGEINADKNCEVAINGGSIYIDSAGDGIDSNGYIYINGGNLMIDGPTNSGGSALDSGAGIVSSGGEGIAIGPAKNAKSFGEKSSVNNVSWYFNTPQKAGAKIEIKNNGGDIVISHTSAKPFSHLAAMSQKLNYGDTYYLFIDGSLKGSFKVESVVTTVGSYQQTQ